MHLVVLGRVARVDLVGVNTVKGRREYGSAVVDAAAFNVKVRFGVRVRLRRSSALSWSALRPDRRVRSEVIVAGQGCPLRIEVVEVRNEGKNSGWRISGGGGGGGGGGGRTNCGGGGGGTGIRNSLST